MLAPAPPLPLVVTTRRCAGLAHDRVRLIPAGMVRKLTAAELPNNETEFRSPLVLMTAPPPPTAPPVHQRRRHQHGKVTVPELRSRASTPRCGEGRRRLRFRIHARSPSALRMECAH